VHGVRSGIETTGGMHGVIRTFPGLAQSGASLSRLRLEQPHAANPCPNRFALGRGRCSKGRG
jgi:hypothetical protein